MEIVQRYPSDLSDGQWDRISHLIPEPKPGGRPAKYSRRDVTNALLFVVRNRCSWRSLPRDLPPWRVVYWYYSQWKKSGVLDRVLAEIGMVASPGYLSAGDEGRDGAVNRATADPREPACELPASSG
jgi:hypothetical protein